MFKLISLIYLFAFCVGDLLADQPAEPTTWMMVSENQEYCFRMVPEKYHFKDEKKVVDRKAFGIASEMGKDGSLKDLWRVEGWYCFSGYLSNDGRYFVRMGPWASDQENHTDLAVAFYDRGELLKEYRVKDLIKDATTLDHSVSHYQWMPEKQSKPTGLVDPWSSKLFHLVMIDHTIYDFDFTTGKISKTGVDKRALSRIEISSIDMEKAVQRGASLLQSSAEEAPLKALFAISELSSSKNSKTYGLSFEEAEWSAKLTPKTSLTYPCEVHAIHPVTTNGKLQIGIKPEEVLETLKTIVSHPYVENRFKTHSAEGIRLRVAGNRLHWDTDEVREMLGLLKMKHDTLDSFRGWAQVIVDEPKHVYHSFYLNVLTGQIMMDDVSKWPYGALLFEKNAKFK
jgi:hypothetical protein